MMQIVLNAKTCSGRGVRCRLLTLDERHKIYENAALDVGAEATVMQLRVREGKDAVSAMVTDVTEKTGFKTPSELVKAGADAGWKKVTFQELNDNSAKYFNAKDMSVLVNLFRKLHDVTDKEVDDILGEALEVTDA